MSEPDTFEALLKRIAHSYVDGPNCGWYDDRKGKTCDEPPDGKHHIRYGPDRDNSWMHEFEAKQVHDPNCACKGLESLVQRVRELLDEYQAFADAGLGIKASDTVEQLTALLGKESAK